ncbi:MAG: serine/threonine-protein kinase [Pseudanabaenaceae cyanobacterium SKYGB_i_bin29]|nr:serine/threonine protein kinase [Pseudanabaenaceae cyanobacterium SKYG29]MDW8421566.1 serine/threonine-protein kinase [Pseudanabaenaceae cyanobacterium SKYGB_i_bin29]
MSYCINPHCALPNHPENRQKAHCASCGSPLVIAGKYRVEGLLSDQGGFSLVYRASTGKEAKILKVLRVEHNTSRKAVKLFVQEGEVLSKLRHPGIPKIDGYFTHTVAGRLVLHCLVMEKIPGMNLEEWQVQKRYQPLAQEQAIEWLKALVEVLGVVHQRRFLHRDIKPSNIMLTPEGKLVLIDFGTARDVTSTYIANIDKGRSMTAVVSSGYTAPEQTNGRAVPQSDFYALGRTFVHLLTGKHPLDMYDPDRDVLHWRSHAPGITPAFADLLDQMMNRKPGDRPADAKALLRQLELVERVVKQSGTGTASLPSPGQKRLPWQGIFLAVGVSLAAIGWYFRGTKGAVVGAGVGLGLIYASYNYTKVGARLKQSLLAHAKTNTALTVTPDGQFLISAGGDRTVRVWHSKTRQRLHNLVGHGDWVYSVVVTPGGQLILSGSGDKTIKVWQCQSGLPLETLEGHELGVTCLAVAGDESWLVSGSNDKTLKVWDLRTYKLLKTINNLGQEVNAVVVTPDHQIISADRSIKVWSIDKNIPQRVILGHQQEVLALALSRDGKQLFSGSADQTIKCWDWLTGQLVRTFIGHKGEVKTLVVHPTKSLLFSGATDRRIGIWEMSTGKLLLVLKGHKAAVTCLAISPNGKWLYSGGEDGVINIWRL